MITDGCGKNFTVSVCIGHHVAHLKSRPSQLCCTPAELHKQETLESARRVRHLRVADTVQVSRRDCGCTEERLGGRAGMVPVQSPSERKHILEGTVEICKRKCGQHTHKSGGWKRLQLTSWSQGATWCFKLPENPLLSPPPDPFGV